MFSDKLEWGHFRDDQQGRFNFGTIVQLSLCRGRRGCLGDQGRFNLVQSSLCRGASRGDSSFPHYIPHQIIYDQNTLTVTRPD